MLLLSACSADVVSDSTSVPTTSSTTTSTSVQATTTTTLSPTTTTPPTTTALIEGNWASQPLVVWNEMALGWWSGSDWVGIQPETALPIAGGEDYQLALLGEDGILQGGPPESEGCGLFAEDPFPSVEFEEKDALSRVIDDGEGGERVIRGIAISAPWSIDPRQVSEGEASQDLEKTAMDLLATRGFVTETAKLVQVLDVDVDGDGTNEAFVVAEDTELANEATDVYSIVFAVSPAWTSPILVEESVFVLLDTGFPASFRVSAIADLTGDGFMEVVLSVEVWEGNSVGVYELDGEAFQGRLTAGCGV